MPGTARPKQVTGILAHEWVAGALGQAVSLLLEARLQGTGLETENLGPEPVFIWDAPLTSSGLSACITAPALFLVVT